MTLPPFATNYKFIFVPVIPKVKGKSEAMPEFWQQKSKGCHARILHDCISLLSLVSPSFPSAHDARAVMNGLAEGQ